jgi:hypothetical protein
MATSTLGSGTLVLAGTTSGTTTVTATAVAGTTTLTLPAATDTLVGKATTDTLTNKTLTGAAMNGTLGATTPSTGAFTTVTASGLADARFFRATANATANSANSVMMDFVSANNIGRIISQGPDVSTGANFQIRLTASDGIGAVTNPALFSSSGVSITNTVGVGGATPSTSGAGITFPATQSASTDANTLDDYEEGTWTPSLGGTATYTARAGTYTKLGNCVTAVGYIEVATIGTGATNNVTGLPFAASGSNSYSSAVGYWNNTATSFAWIGAGIFSGTPSTIRFVTTTAVSATTSVSAAVWGNSAQVHFTISYLV